MFDIYRTLNLPWLHERVDSEHEQAFIRIVICGLCTTYASLYHVFNGLTAHLPYIVIIAVYFAFSVFLFAHIAWKPAVNPIRRYVGIAGDMGTLSVCIYGLSHSAALLFPLYLWVIIGNGLRFGQRYLYTAQGIALTGFSTAMILNPFWSIHWSAGIGILISIVALPVYFSILIGRLHASNKQLNALLEKTEQMATHDTLTELPNRNLLFDRLQYAIACSQRTRIPFAILFLDLDGFKRINDDFGHTTGDRLLQQVAQRLTQNVRRSDTVARIGGDEFIMLLRDVDQDYATEIAHKLLAVLGQSFLIDRHHFNISTSIGVALFPNDGNTVDDLINHADMAMYNAKQRGKNRYTLYKTQLPMADLIS